MPILGPIYTDLVSGHPVLVYVAFLAVPVAWWTIYETRFGLRLRAVGGQPAAVDTAGLSVAKLRYAFLAINGVPCGLAGAYVSVAQNAGFGRDMTAGRGYLAPAVVCLIERHRAAEHDRNDARRLE